MDAVSIRVPYRNLRQDAAEEVELVAVGVDDYNHHPHNHHHHRLDNDNNGVEFGEKSARVSPSPNGGIHHSSDPSSRSYDRPPEKHASLWTLILSCTVAAGVQFGWALQLSLLTPYIQVQSVFLVSGLVCAGWMASVLFYFVSIDPSFGNRDKKHRHFGLGP